MALDWGPLPPLFPQDPFRRAPHPGDSPARAILYWPDLHPVLKMGPVAPNSSFLSHRLPDFSIIDRRNITGARGIDPEMTELTSLVARRRPRSLRALRSRESGDEDGDGDVGRDGERKVAPL